MSLFDINILWDTINFLILMFLLGRFLFKPVKKILDERRDKIQGDLDAAKGEYEKAEEIKRQYELRLANVEEEVRQILEAGYAQASQKKEEIIAQAKEEARRELERSRREIDRMTTEARAQLRDELSDLTVLAAGRFLQHSLNEEEHKFLIEKVIEELPAENLGERL